MKKIINNFIYIILIILPIVDIITSFVIRNNRLLTPGVIIRGILLLYMVYTTLFNKNINVKNKRKIILYYIFLILFFEIFILVRINNYIPIDLLIKEIKIFIKIWYFPITLIFFNNYNFNKNKLLRYLKISNILYIIGFILPIILGISFNSYNYDYKGLVGWFYSANEISSLLSINLVISYLILNKKYTLFNAILIILNIISLSLIGTKTSLFSIVIITISSFIIFVLKKGFKSKKTLTSIFIILISIIILMLNKTSYDVLNRLNTNDVAVFNEYDKNNFIFKNLLSGRNINLLNNYNYYKKENTFIKLFGIGFTNTNKLNSIEMDIFDILLKYGLIGSIIFFIPLLYYSIKIIKNIKYNTNNLMCIIGIILILSISFISGHTLTAPMVSIYISICFLLIKED